MKTLALVAMLTLCAACGGGSTPTSPSSQNPSTPPTPAPPPTPPPTNQPLSCTQPSPSTSSQGRQGFGRLGRAYFVYPAGPAGMQVAEIRYSGSGPGGMGVKVAEGGVVNFNNAVAIPIRIEPLNTPTPVLTTAEYRVCWHASAGTPYTIYIWDEPGGGADVFITMIRPAGN